MGLLDRLVEAYQRNVVNVENPLSTNTTIFQPPEIKHKKETTQWRKTGGEAKNSPKNSASICNDTRMINGRSENVEDVACGRAGRDHIFDTFSSVESQKQLLSQEHLTRASNKYNISFPTCDSCPACGHWDGYGQWKMTPGRYCFYTAYYKGKSAKPVPVVEAQKACPRSNDEE